MQLRHGPHTQKPDAAALPTQACHHPARGSTTHPGALPPRRTTTRPGAPQHTQGPLHRPGAPHRQHDAFVGAVNGHVEAGLQRAVAPARDQDVARYQPSHLCHSLLIGLCRCTSHGIKPGPACAGEDVACIACQVRAAPWNACRMAWPACLCRPIHWPRQHTAARACVGEKCGGPGTFTSKPAAGRQCRRAAGTQPYTMTHIRRFQVRRRMYRRTESRYPAAAAKP